MNRVISIAAIMLAAPLVVAQVPYPTSPDWTSADTPVSTGGALADLDRDGWLDLVVANGNDIYQEPVTVYYNRGDGSFPPTPDWSSDDLAYNGHLSVADVNGDGWLDVAVAVLGNSSIVDNAAKLYLNTDGTLSSLPVWQSVEVANAFACAFGDVNNDGRPDLAIATGWAYSPQNFYPNYVYINQGGILPFSATWISTDTDHQQGVLWVDADHDGWLDLVGVTTRSPTSIYRNLGGVLETTASWHSADAASQDAIMAAAGDVDNDEIRDLLITDNSQLSSDDGYLRLYPGLDEGFYATSYDWSFLQDQGSAVTLGDLDNDGLLDVLSGSWFDRIHIVLNTDSGLPAAADWISTPITVVEKLILADADNDGLLFAQADFAGDRLLYLPHQPIEQVVEVLDNGVPLSAETYTFDREHGWITVGVPDTSNVVVRYVYSRDLDLAVTNWDDNLGNQLYYNQNPGHLFIDGFESGDTGWWSTTVE